MQDIPEPVAPDVQPFWNTDQGLNPPLIRVSAGLSCMMAIICHWRPRKVRSRVGLAEKALVEIQGTERPTALANSARSATARFLEASQAATGRFRIQSQQA